MASRDTLKALENLRKKRDGSFTEETTPSKSKETSSRKETTRTSSSSNSRNTMEALASLRKKRDAEREPINRFASSSVANPATEGNPSGDYHNIISRNRSEVEEAPKRMSLFDTVPHPLAKRTTPDYSAYIEKINSQLAPLQADFDAKEMKYTDEYWQSRLDDEIARFNLEEAAASASGRPITNTAGAAWQKVDEEKNAWKQERANLQKSISELTNVKDYYEGMSFLSAPDFEEYSAKGAAVENPTPEEAQGYLWGLVGAKEINNPVTYARENLPDSGIKLGEKGNSRYHRMTDEEVDVYNYLLSKFGKERAQVFLDALENGAGGLTEREGKRRADALTGIDIPVVEDAAVLAYDVGGSAINAVTHMDDMFKDEPQPTTAHEYARDYIDKDWSDDSFKVLDKTPRQWLHSGANTIGEMAPMLAVTALAPQVGAPAWATRLLGGATTFLTTSGRKYSEVLSEGYDRGDAYGRAIPTGLSEAGLQMAIGGLSSMGGVSDTRLMAKARAINNPVGRWGAVTGLKMGGEIIEENSQNYIDAALDSFVLGKEYKAPTWSEAVETSVISALTVLVLEGGNISGDAGSRSVKIGEDIIKEGEEAVTNTIEAGLAKPEGTGSRDIAEKITNAVKNGDKISPRDLGVLAETIVEESNGKGAQPSTLEEAAEMRINDRDIHWADDMTTLMENTEETAKEKPTMRNVLRDEPISLGVFDGQTFVTNTDTILPAHSSGKIFLPVNDAEVAKTELGATEDAKVGSFAGKLLSNRDYTPIKGKGVDGTLPKVGDVRVFTDDEGREVALPKDVAEYFDGYNLEATFRGGKPYAVKATDSDGNVAGIAMAVWNNTSGESYNITEAKPMTEQTRQKREAGIRKLTGFGDYGVKAFTDIVESLPAGDISMASKIFNTAYRLGMLDTPMDKMNFTNELQRIAFNAGKQDYIMSQNKAVENVKNVLSYGDKAGLDRTNAPSDVTSEELDFAGDVLKALGVRGYFGGNSSLYNAKMTPNKGDMVIANDFRRTMIRDGEEIKIGLTQHIIHEAPGHRVKELAPKEYAAYEKAMYKHLEKKDGKGLADERRQKYAAKKVDLTVEGAIEEESADHIFYLYDYNLDEVREAWTSILNGTDEQAKSGLRKYKQALDYVISKLNTVLEKVGLRERNEIEAGKRELMRIRALYEKALRAAVKKNAEIASKTTVGKNGVITNANGDVVAQLNEDGTIKNPKSNLDSKFSVKYNEKIKAEQIALYKDIEKGAKKFDSSINLNELKTAQSLVDNVIKQINEMPDKMMLFPVEVLGRVMSSNHSYGVSIDGTRVCFRTVTFNHFNDMVQEIVGRPLNANEQLVVNEKLRIIAKEPQCLVCYVALDRKAYWEDVLWYMDMRDKYISLWDKSDKSDKAFQTLYKRFLRERVDSIAEKYRKKVDNIKSTKKTYRGVLSEYLNEPLKGEDFKIQKRYKKSWEASGKTELEAKKLIEDYVNTWHPTKSKKGTAEMEKRLRSWLAWSDSGATLLKREDLTTQDKIEELFNQTVVKGRSKLKGDNGATYADGDLATQYYDLNKYAQSASWAKKADMSEDVLSEADDTFGKPLVNVDESLAKYQTVLSYWNDIRKLSPADVARLNNEYGLRFYSYSEFNTAFLVDNLQEFIDASLVGLKTLMYTKSYEGTQLFAPTGANINVGVILEEDGNGSFRISEEQSTPTSFENLRNLRNKYPNVGIVAVATTREMVEWATQQDWADVVIPFHTVRNSYGVSEMRWEDHKSEQEDKKPSKRNPEAQDKWKTFVQEKQKEGLTKEPSASIMPFEHNNDFDTYIALCNERGITPRFESFLPENSGLTKEQYMKLVNETRRSARETPITKPTFDESIIPSLLAEFKANGGYRAQYKIPDADVKSHAEEVAKDIKLGKSAIDVEYGTNASKRIAGAIMRGEINRDNVPRVHGQSTSPMRHSSTEGKKFSFKDSVEETKDLVAVHNASEKQLLDALSRGQFIMPSLAVTNKGHTAFGDISILFNKDTIDPNKDANNKLYGSDAWTPTQTELKKNPKFDDKATSSAIKNIRNSLGNLAPQLFNANIGRFKQNIEKADGSLYNAYAHNIGMQTAYAMENGLISSIPTKDGKVDTAKLKESLGAVLDIDSEWRAYKGWLSDMSNSIITSYDKASNEDIIRTMKAQPDYAKTFKLTENGKLTAPVVEYSSIDDFRSNKGRLSHTAEQEADALGKNFLKWAKDVSASTGVKLGDVVNAINSTFDSRYNDADISKAFAKSGITLSRKNATALQSLYKKAVELPTPYFEAKPQRSVGVNEVAAVVLPDNASKALLDKLEGAGVNILTYENGNEADRLAKVNSVENVKFSMKDDFSDLSEREYREASELSDTNTKYSLREKEPPKKTGIAYKVFYAKDGQLYPPMVANPNGEGTPVGVWLDADIGKAAPDSKTGRPQVQAGGKGTNASKGSLAFRPGWHLGDIPHATQFARKNPETGVKDLFPADFVWAECEYAMDNDYQEEAMSYGYTENGKFRHSYAGLPKLPTDGYYRYRTNPNPDTVPWIITGAMKVNRILTDAETDAICRENGVEPMKRQGGELDLAKYGLEAGETNKKFSLKGTERLSKPYSELIKEYGAIPKGEKPFRDIQVPQKTAEDKKVSQTVRTILEAKATPDELVPNIEKMVEEGAFSYDVYTDKKAISDAESYIREYGWGESLDDWFDAMNKGEVSKELTTMGWALYNNAANTAANATSEAEKKSATKTALKILDAMVKHQRNAAQALQATRILKKLSPETQLYGVQKSVQAFQRELEEKYGDKAPNLKVNEQLAEQFLKAKTEEERAKAEEEIYKDIGRQMPSTFIDKWNAWRYLAMLGNFRTHGRNIVGNAGFAPIVALKNLTATAIESAVSRVSGNKTARSKAFLTLSKADRDLLSAAWQDYSNVADMISNGGKYSDFAMANQAIEAGRQIFKFKPLEAARKGNSKLLEMEDMWFALPHYANALAQYCKANNISAEQLRNGKALGAARQYAIKEAQKATYRDTNAFSQMVSEWGRSNKNEKNVAKKAFNMTVEGILPFRKTPANILVRGVEYSPIGLLKALSYDLVQVSKGKMTSAEAIDNISAGLTGTGLLALGVWLAAEGLIRGHGEDDEEKEFKELMGHQSYALELPNGTSVTLDWLAPEALPFFIGVNLWEAKSNTDEEMTLSTILKAVSSISEPMLEMSCLQSLNDVLESVGYASSNDTSGLVSVLSSAATSYLTQGLPTLLGQAERTGEEHRMTTYTEKNSFLTGDMQYAIGKASAKIPFVDYHQIPYIDAWGRKEASGTALKRGLNNFLNPAYVSTIKTSPMEKELMKLYEKTGDDGVFPSRADKYFTVDGKRKDLTAEEYVRYATLKGEKSYKAVTDLVKSSDYKSLSNEEKAEAIKKVYDYANQKAKQSVSNYKPEKWVSTADKFGSNVGNFISFQTEVASTKKKNGNKISKQEVVDIALDMASNDDEIWNMYLSEYSSKADLHARDIGIEGEDYMNIIQNLDVVDQPSKSGKLGTYSNNEIAAAISMVSGLSRSERAELWQSMTGSQSTKNNPWR